MLDVRCASNPSGPCVESHRAAPGASLRLIGRNLGAGALVVFYGERGPKDDVTAPASPVSAQRATTSVPEGARTGPVAVVDLAGRRSRRWTGLLVEALQPAFGVLRPPGAPAPVEAAVSKPRTLFYGGPQKAVFSYRALGASPMDLRVNLVRVTDNVIVKAWNKPRVAPGSVNRVLWAGAVRGRIAREASSQFVISIGGAAATSVRAGAKAVREDAITVYDHIFPVRGAHDFGGSGADFGSGRAGHSHQGQDIPAACGTPLVAARGGKVKFSGYHSAAGYYLVIDGQGTDVDYVYMHLRERAQVQVGDRVFTGQEIGAVGESGNARGCNLHFEEWAGPGWYDGGRPFDPLPDLKRWDRTS